MHEKKGIMHVSMSHIVNACVSPWILDYMDWKRPSNGMLRPFYGPFST